MSGLRDRQSTPILAVPRWSHTREAYERAFATDPVAAFGGIVAFNHELDAATAGAVFQTVSSSRDRARIRHRSTTDFAAKPTYG